MSATAETLLSSLADLIAERVAARLATSARERDSKPAKALPDFLSEIEVAKRYGLSRRTLQTWRGRGEGPPTVKAGRKVLYSRADLDSWLAENNMRRRARRSPR